MQWLAARSPRCAEVEDAKVSNGGQRFLWLLLAIEGPRKGNLRESTMGGSESIRGYLVQALIALLLEEAIPSRDGLLGRCWFLASASVDPG